MKYLASFRYAACYCRNGQPINRQTDTDAIQVFDYHPMLWILECKKQEAEIRERWNKGELDDRAGGERYDDVKRIYSITELSDGVFTQEQIERLQ